MDQAAIVNSLKSLARRHNRSMEQDVRELLAGHVVERRSVLAHIEGAWSKQARRPTPRDVSAREVDGATAGVVDSPGMGAGHEDSRGFETNDHGQSPAELARFEARYRDGLFDTVRFWFPRAADAEHGGYLLFCDRDGTLFDTDKGIWQTGRTSWMLSTLFLTVERRPEWLEWARLGIDFLRRHGFDADGRMYFHVTRDGRPIRQRRYYFSETFACMAFAAYASASGDERAAEEARGLFGRILEYAAAPGLLPAKFTGTRPLKGLVAPIITIATAQALRETIGDPRADGAIDGCIAEIGRDFVKPDLGAVLEAVAPGGSFVDHADGRLLNPGHAIEGAWFILHEAKHRRDPALVALGSRMLDLMWPWGWDAEYGGILAFRDVKNLPVQEYWHDMKFWWPQNEAVIATLLAYQLTGEARYAQWHRDVSDWAHEKFADPVHGEWFGYLHRDGRVSTTTKGNLWKGFFHLPRMQWYCWRLVRELQARPA